MLDVVGAGFFPAPPTIRWIRPAEVRERVLPAMPTGWLGEIEEVAFLASERAGYITGQEISIAGGADLNLLSPGSTRVD